MSGFSMALAGSQGFHVQGTGWMGAKVGRRDKDWDLYDLDPNELVATDGHTLSARSADLLRNNAIVAACANALRDGVVGAEGLRFVSKYGTIDPADYRLADGSPEAEEELTEHILADEALRDRIDYCIAQAIRGKSIDAQGQLSWKQLQDLAVTTKGTFGQFYVQRVFKPHRPGINSHATCFRVLHPSRRCNPDFAPDSATLRNGVKLGADDEPLGMYFLSRHPGRVVADDKPTWTYVPFYDDMGLPVLMAYVNRTFPEQVVGTPYAATVMQLVKQIGGVVEAHVVAKRVQAAISVIFEVDNPVKSAKADKNGEVLTKNTRFAPGKVYYAKKGTLAKFQNVQYQGQDLKAFLDSMLEFICAGYGPGMPRQYVLRQLTDSNLAAARAALMQAWRAFRAEQNDLIGDILHPMILCLLAEDLLRHRLVLPTGLDLYAAAAGRWRRPARLSTDDYREMQAAQGKRALGWSRSTVMDEHDGDFQEEREQEVRDRLLDKRLGLTEQPAGVLKDLPQDDEKDDGKDDKDDKDDQAKAPPPAAPAGDDDDEGDDA